MALGVCLVCAGGLTAAETGRPAAAAIPRGPVVTAPAHEHTEQPHPAELEAAHVTGPSETGIRELHPLTLDHPRYGVLGGPVFLACEQACPLVPGCQTCPLRADAGYARALPQGIGA